jgi:NADPH-dependent 2,4-dienoyl-CoA reductase/sulfur reductase-like enzyme
MSQPEHVLVVGAGLGGLRTVEQLRTAGFQGRISLVGDEPHAPYDRPPLSKQVLTGEWAPERATLRSVDGLDELGVRTHLGLRAVALRPGEVELADGASLHADAIVVATGLAARTLPGQPAGVHTLRTLDDALSLRSALERGRSLLVIGGGFIGAEVASSARTRGLAVTVLEVLPAPSARALGEELGALTGRLMAEAGVDLRTGARIDGFLDAGGRIGVALADGARVEADVAVVGIGGVPRLGWMSGGRTGDGRTGGTAGGAAGPAGHADGAAGSAGGLACGLTGRVEGLSGVWAVGDVAAWLDPTRGDRHRHEHWTSAGEQAATVARDILGEPPPPPRVPYFWSDQFGLKIQLFGRPEHADTLLPLHGDGLAGGAVKGTVVGMLADGQLAAVVGFGAARLVARYRALLQEGADGAAARELAGTIGAR